MANAPTRKPEDYVIATGRMITVRKFVEIAAQVLNWSTNDNPNGIYWEGEGINEIGRRADTNEVIIRVNPRYFRPTEVQELQGDSTKAFNKFGWKPKISLEELIKEMVENDRKEALKELKIQK